MVEGIIYRYRTGIPWRDLPREQFGPWQTGRRHRRFAGDGTWDQVLTALLAQADAAGLVDWSVSVDSTINRAHQHAGVHHAVDGRGRPLVVIVAPGQGHDGKMLPDLLDEIRVPRLGPGRPRTRPDKILGDKAYSSRATRTLLRSRGIDAVIPEPCDQRANRQRRGARGGRPVSYDHDTYKGRDVVERSFVHLKQWLGLATCYDKLAIVYRAAAVLAAAITWLRHIGDTL